MAVGITIFRLILAFALGGIIGLEREKHHKPAGVRTHIMVGVGSALAMMIGIKLSGQFNEVDPTRLSAQVISGLGFLGMGIIWKEGMTIKGLTTSASIWIIAIVGLAVGCGYYEGAITASVLLYIALVSGRRPKNNKRNTFMKKNNSVDNEFAYEDDDDEDD